MGTRPVPPPVPRPSIKPTSQYPLTPQAPNIMGYRQYPAPPPPKPTGFGFKESNMGYRQPQPTPMPVSPIPDSGSHTLNIKLANGSTEKFTFSPAAVVELRDSILRDFPVAKTLEEECVDGILCDPEHWRKTKEDLKKYKRLSAISIGLAVFGTILGHLVK